MIGDIEITPALRDAFRAYINSPAQPVTRWAEEWALRDALIAAGVPEASLCVPCCWHPSQWFHPWNPFRDEIYRWLRRG